MGLTRLLRKSAALPLRVAEAAADTTAGVITGLVRFAGTAAATVVGGGVALATAPVRSAAGLLTDVAESHSPGSLVREFVGGTPARRSSRGAGRAWIEVRGLRDPLGGPAIAGEVLSALRAHPGVTSAVVNYPLSRVVVWLDEDGPAVDLSELCGVIAVAENGSSKPAGGAREPPIDLPGDSAVLAGRLVALAATSAGLCAALVGRAVPWPRLPAGVAAAVTILDYQPRVRRLLENRYGTSVTDTTLAVAWPRPTPRRRRGRRSALIWCCNCPGPPSHGPNSVPGRSTNRGSPGNPTADTCFARHDPGRSRQDRWNVTVTAARWRSSSARWRSARSPATLMPPPPPWLWRHRKPLAPPGNASRAHWRAGYQTTIGR